MMNEIFGFRQNHEKKKGVRKLYWGPNFKSAEGKKSA